MYVCIHVCMRTNCILEIYNVKCNTFESFSCIILIIQFFRTLYFKLNYVPFSFVINVQKILTFIQFND